MRRRPALDPHALAAGASPSAGARRHRATRRVARARSPRRRRLPAPLPQRRVHPPDPRPGPAGLPRRRCRATTRACRSTRAVRAVDGFARLGDPDQGPGLDNPARCCARSVGAERPRRYRARAPCWCSTRGPAAASRSGSSSTPTRHRPRPPAGDPPRAQPAQGRRYVVVLRYLERADGSPSRPAGVRRAARPPRAPARATTASSTPCAAAKVARDERSTWPGTSPWPASARSAAGCCTSATMRSHGWATQPRDRKVQGRAPTSGSPPGDRLRRPMQNPYLARVDRGRDHRPRYLDQPGCPPGSRFNYAPATPQPRRSPATSLTCVVPARCRARRRGPARSRCTATACSGSTPRSAPATCS